MWPHLLHSKAKWLFEKFGRGPVYRLLSNLNGPVSGSISIFRSVKLPLPLCLTNNAKTVRGLLSMAVRYFSFSNRALVLAVLSKGPSSGPC